MCLRTSKIKVININSLYKINKNSHKISKTFKNTPFIHLVMIIDGTNLILGRVATFTAKSALEGEQIVIVNCEKIIVTGRKKFLISQIQMKQGVGHPFHGPFFPKMPDRMVKRVIRGMLPYKQERGIKAFKRVKCFMGIPEQYQNQKLETIQKADASKLKTLQYLTINDLAKYFGKGYS